MTDAGVVYDVAITLTAVFWLAWALAIRLVVTVSGAGCLYAALGNVAALLMAGVGCLALYDGVVAPRLGGAALP